MQESNALVDAVREWQPTVDARQRGFFLALRHPMAESETAAHGNSELGHSISCRWEIASLRSYEQGFFDDAAEKDQFVAFADPSTYPHYPGWMLRNLLVLVRQRWNRNRVQFLRYRDIQNGKDKASNVVFTVVTQDQRTDLPPLLLLKMPKISGWERNTEGKITSKVVNLAAYMDPHR